MSVSSVENRIIERRLTNYSHAKNSVSSKILWFLAYLLLAVVTAWIFAQDWIGEDGWWCTWICFAIVYANCTKTTPLASGCWCYCVATMGIGASFWWAQDMLAYTLSDEDGTISRCFFAGLVLWESIPFGVLGVLISRSARSRAWHCGLIAPIAFLILVEAYWPRVFTWTLAHTQLGFLPLCQSADIGGTSLVTFFVLITSTVPMLMVQTISAALSEYRNRSLRLAIIFLSLITANLSYGIVRIAQIESVQEHAKRRSIFLIQEDPSYNDALRKMRGRSLSVHHPIDLIVWPESSLGAFSSKLKNFADSEIATQLGLPPYSDTELIVGLPAKLLIGGRRFTEDSSRGSDVQYQTAFVVAQNGEIVDEYYKRSLMPLGEYVPFEQYFPWLHDLFQLNEYMVSGTDDQPLVIDEEFKVGVLICYEDTDVQAVRRTAKESNMLICIINASAFQSPIALRQHMRLSHIRSIENRRYLLRCAGTGVSSCISATGKITNRVEADRAGEILVDVPLLQNSTVFQSIGNFPVLVSACYFIFAALRTSLSRRSHGPPSVDA